MKRHGATGPTGIANNIGPGDKLDELCEGHQLRKAITSLAIRATGRRQSLFEQQCRHGELANWRVTSRGGSIGGAMDLATGARRLIIAMEHCTSAGEAKIVARCTYPLIAERAVDVVVTDLAVISVEADGLLLREMER